MAQILACKPESVTSTNYFFGLFILEEIWKAIENYPDFEISSLAQIRRVSTGKVLKQAINKTGYYQVCASLGQRKTLKAFKIHKVVAKAFVPNPENKPIVNHIDGDKLNSLPSNLEWATYSENSQHAYDNSLIIPSRGEDHYFSKLTNKDIVFIREHYRPRCKAFGARALGRMFNVSHAVISRVCSNQTWTHI